MTDKEISSILLVEPDPGERERLCKLLSGSDRAILAAGSLEQAQAFLSAKPAALAVLEWPLEAGGGRALLERLRQSQVPALVWTRRPDPALQAECLGLGADAVLARESGDALLAAAVTGRLRKRRDLAAASRQEALQEGFSRLRSLCARSGEPLSIGVLDVDGLGTARRRFGPRLAEELLRLAAGSLSRSLRESDLLVRWRDSAFVVLLPNTPLPGAVRALEKCREALSRKRFRISGKETLAMTLSGGAAEADVKDRDSLPKALEEAAGWLDLAKAGGENRILCAERGRTPESNRILLAEGDPLTASLVAHRLEQEGFEVRQAADGAEALKAAGEGPSRLVILDAQLTRVGGLEVLQRLRAMGAYARTPVLVLSALDSEKDVAQALEAGANDHLVKPLSPIELVARVRRLLKGVRA